jgi:hypothetical protein
MVRAITANPIATTAAGKALEWKRLVTRPRSVSHEPEIHKREAESSYNTVT